MQYKERPCKCGHTVENNFLEYEIFKMKMGTFLSKKLPNRHTLRCKTCKKVSILERVEDLQKDKDDVFEGLPSLKKIVDTIIDSKIF